MMSSKSRCAFKRQSGRTESDCVLMEHCCQFVPGPTTAFRRGQWGHDPATRQHKCRYGPAVRRSVCEFRGGRETILADEDPIARISWMSL